MKRKCCGTPRGSSAHLLTCPHVKGNLQIAVDAVYARHLSPLDVLESIPDDLPDGAFWAMAGEMGVEPDDLVRDYEGAKQERQVQSQRRRQFADQDFPAAAEAARAAGMTLVKRSETHYQLRRGWLINVYPGNRRVYCDPHKPGPYLTLPRYWTLMDVVQAAIDAPPPRIRR